MDGTSITRTPSINDADCVDFNEPSAVRGYVHVRNSLAPASSIVRKQYLFSVEATRLTHPWPTTSFYRTSEVSVNFRIKSEYRKLAYLIKLCLMQPRVVIKRRSSGVPRLGYEVFLYTHEGEGFVSWCSTRNALRRQPNLSAIISIIFPLFLFWCYDPDPKIQLWANGRVWTVMIRASCLSPTEWIFCILILFTELWGDIVWCTDQF